MTHCFEVGSSNDIDIGEQTYIVTVVGELANHHLAMLGPVTLKFDGQLTPDLPGTIHRLGPKLSQVLLL